MIDLPGFEYFEKEYVKSFKIEELVWMVHSDLDEYLYQKNDSYLPPKDFEKKIEAAINDSGLFELIHMYEKANFQNAKREYYQFIKQLNSVHRLSPSIQESTDFLDENDLNKFYEQDDIEPIKIDQISYSFIEKKIVLFLKNRASYSYDIQSSNFKKMSKETQQKILKIKSDLKILENFSILGIQQLSNRIAMKRAFYKLPSK